MKILIAATLALNVLFPVLGSAQSSPAAGASDTAPLAGATAAEKELTPAEQRIAAAEKQIAGDAKKTQAYGELAEAYLRRARESGDAKYNAYAEQALATGFKLDPKDFQLEKTQVALMLARGEFAQAKEKAALLNRRTPDDVMLYGYLADAEIGLGDYSEAVKNAQWMLNMLPNNVPGLMIGAAIREHFGDASGAIEFLNLACMETSPTEVEELAWIENKIASIDIDSGKIDAAIEMLDRAELTFPNYLYTARNLARARQVQAPLQKSVAAQAPVAKIDSGGEPAGMQDKTSGQPLPAARGRDDAEFAFQAVPPELLTPRASETDLLIRKAQAKAAAHPKDVASYAALGADYFQRARETGDVSDFELAEKALNQSLDLDSSDFAAEPALETMAAVCMGEHRFADAANFAAKALALGTGDVSPFAILGDAYADMGEYDKARDAYERMTPPDGAPSPRIAYARDSRMAFLDFVRGDTQAAIRGMKAAVEEGNEAEIATENLAWLSYELGEFHAHAGEAGEADAAYLAALRIHPGDYRALAALARLRANHGRVDDAIALYRKAIAVVPMPAFVAELGDLYEQSRNAAEAKKQFDLVEYIGKLGRVNQVLHNRDLALFYADHDLKLDESLALARKEFEVRHDIYTWDALAWALYKNGRFAEAGKASDAALKHGTRDALLLFHAGMIAERLGQPDEARRDLSAALAVNPRFSVRYSDAARHELAMLEAGSDREESAVGHAR